MCGPPGASRSSTRRAATPKCAFPTHERSAPTDENPRKRAGSPSMKVLFHCEGDDGRNARRAARGARQAAPRRRAEAAGGRRSRRRHRRPSSGSRRRPSSTTCPTSSASTRSPRVSITCSAIRNCPRRRRLFGWRTPAWPSAWPNTCCTPVLRAQRRVPLLEEAARERRWTRDVEFPRADSFGVGILGAGVLARAVAARLALNGYPVSCWSRTEKTMPGRRLESHRRARPGTLPRRSERARLPAAVDRRDARPALRRAVHSVCRVAPISSTPLAASTWSRPICSPPSTRGRLGGAMLDVFRTERCRPGTRSGAMRASASRRTSPPPTPTDAATEQVADNLSAIARGEAPIGLVDRGARLLRPSGPPRPIGEARDRTPAVPGSRSCAGRMPHRSRCATRRRC